jgi:hypothetical protein
MRARLAVLGALPAALARTIVGDQGANRVTGTGGPDVLLRGGRGDDTIPLRSGAYNRVDAGPSDDLVTAVITRGRGACGPGQDAVNVSRFKGNPRRVNVAGDCERIHRG